MNILGMKVPAPVAPAPVAPAPVATPEPKKRPANPERIVNPAPRKPAISIPRASLEYLLEYCSTNPARFKSLHAHVQAVRDWLETQK